MKTAQVKLNFNKKVDLIEIARLMFDSDEFPGLYKIEVDKLENSLTYHISSDAKGKFK